MGTPLAFVLLCLMAYVSEKYLVYVFFSDYTSVISLGYLKGFNMEFEYLQSCLRIQVLSISAKRSGA